MKIDVLDKGFVHGIDHLGSDLTVVNSARVSFGKQKNELDDDDRKLMRYLARDKHWSPFRHQIVTFHIKAPEFVMRQWYKHVVGITYSEAPTVDHAWNEVSLRYTDASDIDVYKGMFMPPYWSCCILSAMNLIKSPPPTSRERTRASRTEPGLLRVAVPIPCTIRLNVIFTFDRSSIR